MSPGEQEPQPYAQSPSGRLMNDSYRLPVESLVSAYYRREWRAASFRDMDEFSSHPSAILSDGQQAVFVKLSQAAHGLDQFEVELAGLRLLSEKAGALIPTPVGILTVGEAAILVLEAVEPVARGREQWREIGRALARIHQVWGEQFGFERQGYFGPLYQDNRPAPDWLTFFAERRVWPYFIGAIDSGHMTSEVIRLVERFIQRLPGLEISPAAPTLLHGDAQQNNFISSAAGAVLIDPAVYYGHPEMDLAYVDYFQPVPADVFDAYQEMLPVEPGFAGRRELWRIPAYLAMVNVMGQSELGKLVEAVKQYV